FILIKVLIALIVIVSPVQFDTSSQLIINSSTILNEKSTFLSNFDNVPGLKIIIKYLIENLFDKLMVWDAVYFCKLFQNGIEFEHEWVFGPLWWRFIKNFDSYLISILRFVKNFVVISIDFEKVSNIYDNFYSKLITSVIITNLCHYLSCIIIYDLTAVTFKKNSLFKRCFKLNMPLKSSLLLVLSPSGIFLFAPYSEALSCLISILAIYFREVSMLLTTHSYLVSIPRFQSVFKILLYVISGTLVSIGLMIRSNLLLLGIFYLYDLYEFLRFRKFLNSIISLITGLQVFISLVILNYISYIEYCPQRDKWCSTIDKSLIKFAQSYYWDNGFLKYWSINNIPNFLIVLPILVLFISSIRHFSNRYYCLNLNPMILIAKVYLFLGIFFWNIQILIRISCFLPISIWYLADKLNLTIERQKKTGKLYKNSKKFTINTENLFIFWLFSWIMIQSSLFASFLPPA
ncbi:GPI-anchor transamidase GPI18, partial [Ascoidea rubescens DSM 1968]